MAKEKDIQERTALNRLFDYGLNQCSPVQDDYSRIVKYDEDGNEFIVYEKVDYPKFQKSLGSVNEWSLNSLLEAGISPDFPIRTGMNTRIEGFGDISAFEATADSILADLEKDKNNS